MLLPITFVQLDLGWAGPEGYVYLTKTKENRVCSLAQQASGSEMIGLNFFFSQPKKLFLSIVSTGSRPLSVFFPESDLNIGWQELNCAREPTSSVAGLWPCVVSQQSHDP